MSEKSHLFTGENHNKVVFIVGEITLRITKYDQEKQYKYVQKQLHERLQGL